MFSAQQLLILVFFFKFLGGTATHGVAWSIGPSGGHVMILAKTAEPIAMPLDADSREP